MSNEFGIRGRMPRYRLGRYGPHSSDALLDDDSPSDGFGNALTNAHRMSRTSENMTKYSIPYNRCSSQGRRIILLHRSES